MKRPIGWIILFFVIALASIFLYNLSPVNPGANAGVGSGAAVASSTASGSSKSESATTIFEIQPGEGFRTTVASLYAEGLVRSPLATEIYLLMSGRALTLKPGLYKLSDADWVPEIADAIAGGNAGEATVTIPEGSNIYQIDGILSDALIIHPGALIAFNDAIVKNGGASSTLEGQLFPDTYQFFTDTNASTVVQEFLENFHAKAEPFFATTTASAAKEDLILASILEKEVPGENDQEIVAGILLKRLKAGMPLDVDATVCYAKLLASSTAACNPLTADDFKIDSPYNTYRYDGLPPGPIGNPGIAAISAAMHPQASPYWYYLSDPATGNTIYAVTLAQQEANQKKYLGN